MVLQSEEITQEAHIETPSQARHQQSKVSYTSKPVIPIYFLPHKSLVMFWEYAAL